MPAAAITRCKRCRPSSDFRLDDFLVEAFLVPLAPDFFLPAFLLALAQGLFERVAFFFCVFFLLLREDEEREFGRFLAMNKIPSEAMQVAASPD